ncbi:MAG: hypothetical protein RIC87_08285 [Kiloniellales bacterium]
MSKDISFATFNLYNLQLPGLHWRQAPYSEEDYAEKISWTAGQLTSLHSDVIAFQELWSAQCLKDAFAAAGLDGEYELIFIGDDWYDIAVAAAIRDPWELRSKTLHKTFDEGFVLKKRGGSRDPEDDEIEVQIDRFSRTVLELEVGHKDHPDLPSVHVLCVHLKSKLPTRLDREERDIEAVRKHASALGAAISTIRRTAEAAALRVIVNDLLKKSDRPLVVLGDLNDAQLSNTLAIISEQPSYRLFESHRAGRSSDAGLYSAGILQEFRSLRDVIYTHEYKGVRESLDHVLVSEQFYDHSRNRLWSFREMKVWNDHLEDDELASSDHGVVAAYFVYDRP